MEEAEAEGPITKRSTETRVDVEEDEVEVEVEGIMRGMKVLVSTATEEEKAVVIFTLLWSAWTVRATEPTSSWWGGGR